MTKLSDALFSPSHVIVLLPLVWISMFLFGLEAFDVWEPDYKRIVAVSVIGYWISVAIELGVFGPWRKGR